jgi:homoserine O-acetyltransferase
MGSSGPASARSGDRRTLCDAFPVITIRDMVRAQALLLDHLGIPCCWPRSAGRWGGMQVLQWAATYPERLRSAVVIASAARHSAQNIAFHEVGRQAIMADPNWRQGEYYGRGLRPRPPAWRWRGWRRTSPICPSRPDREVRPPPAGARRRAGGGKSFGFDADFQVESYLRHQGISFTDRFDANSYLYITRAMDYFDLAEEHGGASPRRSRAAARASAWSASTATGCTRPRKAGRSSMP